MTPALQDEGLPLSGLAEKASGLKGRGWKYPIKHLGWHWELQLEVNFLKVRY